MPASIRDVPRRPTVKPQTLPARGRRGLATPQDRLLDLQRAAGNQAVASLARARPPTVSSPVLQRLDEEEVDKIKADKKLKPRFFAAQQDFLKRTNGDATAWDYLVLKATSLEDLEAKAAAPSGGGKTTTTTTTTPTPTPTPAQQASQKPPTPGQKQTAKQATQATQPTSPASGPGKSKTKWAKASAADYITSAPQAAWGANTATVVQNLTTSTTPFTPLPTVPLQPVIPDASQIPKLIKPGGGKTALMKGATYFTDDTIYFPLTISVPGGADMLLEVHYHPAGGYNDLHVKPLGKYGASTKYMVSETHWAIDKSLLDTAAAAWKAGKRGDA